MPDIQRTDSVIVSGRMVLTAPRFDNIIAALGPKKSRQAINRAVNRAGDMTRTAMRRALVKQTGLKSKTVGRALRTKRSSWSTDQALAYTITVRGGDIRLKHFSARETRAGVSAKPFGVRKLFAGAFIKGGRFPDRKTLNFGGQVMQRIGRDRLPIEVVTSGVVLPEQVVQGESIKAFETVGRAKLVERMSHELNRMLDAAR
jgi:hypothetical protein